MLKLTIGFLFLFSQVTLAASPVSYAINIEGEKKCIPSPYTIERTAQAYGNLNHGCTLEQINTNGIYEINCPKAKISYLFSDNLAACKWAINQ